MIQRRHVRVKTGIAIFASAMLLSLGVAAVPTTRAVLARPATRPTSGPSTQPISTAPTEAQMQAVISGLSDSDWHVRAKTSRLLVERGDDAKPLINAILLRSHDPNVRSALSTALTVIAKSRMLGPSVITMHLKDADARTAFEELSRQCFYNLKPYRNWSDLGNNKATVDIDHQPFWLAMQTLSQKYNVFLASFNYRIGLTNGGSMPDFTDAKLTSVHGPFAVIPSCLTQNKQVTFANGGESISTGVQLQLYIEPKLTVLQGDSFELESVVDDKGKSLIANQNQNYRSDNGNGVWTLSAQLQLPKDGATRIKQFKGSVQLLLRTKVKNTEIHNLATVNNNVVVDAGIPVTFVNCTVVKDSYVLAISIPQSFVNNNNNGMFNTVQQDIQQVRLLDAAGHDLQHSNYEESGDGTLYQIKITYEKRDQDDGNPTGAAVDLLWQTTEESTKVTVPFEFQDLPLFQP